MAAGASRSPYPAPGRAVGRCAGAGEPPGRPGPMRTGACPASGRGAPAVPARPARSRPSRPRRGLGRGKSEPYRRPARPPVRRPSRVLAERLGHHRNADDACCRLAGRVQVTLGGAARAVPLAPSGSSSGGCWLVEVPGIEPGSFGATTGLLRAQPTCAFLGPSSHAGKLLTGPATVSCPTRPRGRVEQLSLLADARHRAEGTPGLTACYRCLGSESEGALIGIGACWCAGHGFRDHPSHPRPASPDLTSEVETIHPLCSCASSLRASGSVLPPAFADHEDACTPERARRFTITWR